MTRAEAGAKYRERVIHIRAEAEARDRARIQAEGPAPGPEGCPRPTGRGHPASARADDGEPRSTPAS